MPSRLTKEQFIAKAKTKHGLRYDYSSVVYKNARTKISITCKEHGEFIKTPTNHLSGQACPKCDVNDHFWTTKKFIESATKIHSGRYTYNKTHFNHTHKKVVITCLIHGDFEQRPNDHINKRAGCPKCANKRVSKSEQQWLNYIGVPSDKKSRQVQIYANGVLYTVDGFVADTNTVYEFLGDFWHGNPKIYESNKLHSVDKRVTYGDLYSKYLNKKSNLIAEGYNVVEIWESEWKLRGGK